MEDNPFNVLQVSIYEDKATITARADELSFTEPDREKIFDAARDILINPRKRLAAEVAFFAEAEIFNVRNIFGELELVDEKFSALNAAALLDKINAARIKSGFPAVQDVYAIEQELANVRVAVRMKIQIALENLPQDSCVQFANELADKILSKKNPGVVVEEFFELYNMNMRPLIVDKYEKVRERLEVIKTSTSIKDAFTGKNFKDLEAELKNFCEVVTPLNKFALAKDAADFPETEALMNLFFVISVELHNNSEQTQEALRILILFEKYFSYIPKIKAEMTNTIAKLQKASHVFLDFLHTVPPFKNIMMNDKLPRWARALLVLLVFFASVIAVAFVTVEIAEVNSKLGLAFLLLLVGIMAYKFRDLALRIVKNLLYLALAFAVAAFVRWLLH